MNNTSINPLTKTFRGTLDNSIAGKNGKYGGLSPYTDQDVSRAKEYLIEMGKDPDVDLEGRSAAHMIAEFACFWLNELKDQLRKNATNQALESRTSEEVEWQIACFERKYKDL